MDGVVGGGCVRGSGGGGGRVGTGVSTRVWFTIVKLKRTK